MQEDEQKLPAWLIYKNGQLYLYFQKRRHQRHKESLSSLRKETNSPVMKDFIRFGKTRGPHQMHLLSDFLSLYYPPIDSLFAPKIFTCYICKHCHTHLNLRQIVLAS